MTTAEFEKLKALATGFKPRTRKKKETPTKLKSIPRDETISLTLPFPPSVNRYWGVSMYGKRYLLPSGKEYKEKTSLLLTMHGYVSGGILEKIKLDIICHEKNAIRRDIDNLLKALLDCMKGYVYNDDWQIDDIRIRRGSICKSNPRIELVITTIGTYELEI